MSDITIERGEDGNVVIIKDNQRKEPERLENGDKLKKKFTDAGFNIKKIEMTPEYTYIKLNSGVICINGVWYWIP